MDVNALNNITSGTKSVCVVTLESNAARTVVMRATYGSSSILIIHAEMLSNGELGKAWSPSMSSTQLSRHYSGQNMRSDERKKQNRGKFVQCRRRNVTDRRNEHLSFPASWRQGRKEREKITLPCDQKHRRHRRRACGGCQSRRRCCGGVETRGLRHPSSRLVHPRLCRIARGSS